MRVCKTLGLVVLFMAMVAGCGGGGSGSTTPTATAVQVDNGDWAGTVTIAAPAALAGATNLVIFVDKSNTVQGSFLFSGGAMAGAKGNFSIVTDTTAGMTISMSSVSGSTVTMANVIGTIIASVDANGKKVATIELLGQMNGQNATGTGTLAKMVPTIVSVNPTHAKVGDTITITGTKFSPVTAENIVKFGNVVGAILSVTADGTSLSVVVPAGATTGTITVVIGAESATSGTFTVDPTPVGPVVTQAFVAVTNSTTIHAGDHLLIIGSGFAANSLTGNIVKIGGVDASLWPGTLPGDVMIEVAVPTGIPVGPASLTVTVNGVASAPFTGLTAQ